MQSIQLDELANVVGGGPNDVNTFDNPRGMGPSTGQVLTNPTPSRPLNWEPPNPERTMFPGFRDKGPPTAEDGRDMADKIRGIGRAFGF